mmetsp:Transcript_22981/g.56155  ORF Transcript_22981/g.56155 Transcript_22981/m.56155 type:complete len:157 (+) Transcript_22981:3-473(+)
MSAFLFEDTFRVKELDMVETSGKAGETEKVRAKMFDKVSRMMATSESYDTEVTLDVNTEIYPVREGDKLKFVLTHTLDETGVEENDNAVSFASSSLLAQYEYAAHGKVFKYAEERGKAVVYVSFGGLLMALRGEPRTLRSQVFEVERRLFLLMRKV